MMGMFDDFRLLGERENEEEKERKRGLRREVKVLASRSFKNKSLKRSDELELIFI